MFWAKKGVITESKCTVSLIEVLTAQSNTISSYYCSCNLTKSHSLNDLIITGKNPLSYCYTFWTYKYLFSVFTFQYPTGLLKKNQGERYNDFHSMPTSDRMIVETIHNCGLGLPLFSIFHPLVTKIFTLSTRMHSLSLSSLVLNSPLYFSPVLFANSRTDLPVSQGCILLISSDWPWRFVGFHSLKPQLSSYAFAVSLPIFIPGS